MIGVNVGIPVPREPFSFGGMYGTLSKYGEHDITGDGAMRFFTTLRKITTKWSKFEVGANEDKAQFK
jgi:malonate-semialdehyde dehydrogenase (acetylating)/methylmalonate-semialdehyde dehydrogenase